MRSSSDWIPVFVTVDVSGHPLSGDVVVRNTIEEAVLADAAGIDSFNIGEHYPAISWTPPVT